jgi:hypothetical protein
LGRVTVAKRQKASEVDTTKKTRTVYVLRDAKTGRFVKQNGRQAPEGSPVGPEKSPDLFLDRFTAHPVVDELMKRLSK